MVDNASTDDTSAIVAQFERVYVGGVRWQPWVCGSSEQREPAEPKERALLVLDLDLVLAPEHWPGYSADGSPASGSLSRGLRPPTDRSVRHSGMSRRSAGH